MYPILLKYETFKAVDIECNTNFDCLTLEKQTAYNNKRLREKHHQLGALQYFSNGITN